MKYDIKEILEGYPKKGKSQSSGKPYTVTVAKLIDEQGKEFEHPVTIWQYVKAGDVVFGDIKSEQSKANPAYTNYTLVEPKEDSSKKTTNYQATFMNEKVLTQSNKFSLLKDIAQKHGYDIEKTNIIKGEFEVWANLFEELLK
jgi:hypothetical protein